MTPPSKRLMQGSEVSWQPPEEDAASAVVVIHAGSSTYERRDTNTLTTSRVEMDVNFAQADIARSQAAADVAKYTHAIPAQELHRTDRTKAYVAGALFLALAMIAAFRPEIAADLWPFAAAFAGLWTVRDPLLKWVDRRRSLPGAGPQ